MQELHATFVGTFNTTPHWAHRARADGLWTPVEVLGWVRGLGIEGERLGRALRQFEVERVVKRSRALRARRSAVMVRNVRVSFLQHVHRSAIYFCECLHLNRWLAVSASPQ